MSGCKTLSTVPSIKQTPPRVSCKQAADPKVPPAPRASEWVEVDKDNHAVLSAVAVDWILDVLGVADKRSELRAAEHACYDDHERKGVITQ